MIYLTVKIRFGDHEIARHGNNRNIRYLELIWEHLNNSIPQSILLNENIKNDDSIIKITHTHILAYTRIEKLYNIILYYYVIFEFFVPTCMQYNKNVYKKHTFNFSVIFSYFSFLLEIPSHTRKPLYLILGTLFFEWAKSALSIKFGGKSWYISHKIDTKIGIKIVT